MPARYKILILFVFLLILFLFTVSPCHSATAPTFSGLPSNIDIKDEIEVNVDFSGNPSYYKEKTYYLRGVFFQSGTKYCSLTQNNLGEWIDSATDTTKLFTFTTNQEGSWSGKLKVKIDTDSSNCSGSGIYQFKVGRYTSSSVSWSDTQSTDVTAPIPEPTPTPESTTTTTSSSEDDNQSEESDSISDQEDQSTEEYRGVVAGYKTSAQDLNEKNVANLEISPIFEATNSATISASGLTNEDMATESSILRKKVNIPIMAGSGLVATGIVATLLKKYNINSVLKKKLWKKPKS